MRKRVMRPFSWWIKDAVVLVMAELIEVVTKIIPQMIVGLSYFIYLLFIVIFFPITIPAVAFDNRNKEREQLANSGYCDGFFERRWWGWKYVGPKYVDELLSKKP